MMIMVIQTGSKDQIKTVVTTLFVKTADSFKVIPSKSFHLAKNGSW